MSPSSTVQERAASNGHAAATDDTFPLDSFLEAAQHLRRPFTVEAVKFKVQATWPKDKPTGGLIVAYIDARLAVERLNLIVPHLWHDDYEALGQKHLICRLTVDGITRQDIGEGQGKGLYSDALKRAAVKFGVGVSLYAIPQMRLNSSDGSLKDARTRDGMTLALTPKGEQNVRDAYAHWLDRHGRESFGDPLNHGDVAGAQGDVEVPADTAPEVEEIATPPLISDAARAKVVQAFEDAGIDDMTTFLTAVGVESTDDLTSAHAKALRTLLDDHKARVQA